MTTTEQPLKRRSWTLCVVLVLGIILVLIGDILLGGIGNGLKASPRAKASYQIIQICTACQNYVIEYGTLPPTSENYRLIKILSGDNPRGITFITLRPSDLSPDGEIVDPWKTPLRIIFDSDSKVSCISAGPDKIFGTADDITNQ